MGPRERRVVQEFAGPLACCILLFAITPVGGIIMGIVVAAAMVDFHFSTRDDDDRGGDDAKADL